ncbi:MAG: PcfJ domain-containing protein, partial [Muribaculaceae bacterium]|nr:PcfJ domain-containing protein [Muribaculaceae bacterium]
GNDNVVISVISSVADMLAEGEAMHHCVYGAGYYRKKDSLILSARDKDGKRLETIEVNLRTFQVEQSRAVCNKTSARHHEILDLMQKNMHLIRAAAVS